MVVVVVESDRLFRKLYRERELQWKMLIQEALEETVSLAQWWSKIYTVVGLSKFTAHKYRSAFKSLSLLRISLVV